MSNLELKGGILEIIASINDKDTLEELKNLLTKFVGNHLQDSDYWEELSELEKSELEAAIEESEEEENLIAHDIVMKKYAKWLDK